MKAPLFAFHRFLFLLFICSPAIAIHWEIIGQDSKAPVSHGEFTADLGKSVGEATVLILDKNKIPYVGNESGLHSIYGTPTGDAAIVVESDDTMRVYGWCYEVDGKMPADMPDKVRFSKQTSTLKWFFAFSLYEKGEWTQCCVPAYLKPLETH